MGATVTQTMMQIPEAKLLCNPEDSTIVIFIVVVVIGLDEYLYTTMYRRYCRVTSPRARLTRNIGSVRPFTVVSFTENAAVSQRSSPEVHGIHLKTPKVAQPGRSSWTCISGAWRRFPLQIAASILISL
ncbi:hypothetical protein CPLU01_08151 [Colletotrichum plurivorum]|uniref:Uncharacterized protein n=1 Tax=Colletotrichum plurivorum TaxID=2175906 RepID=A0A8H6KCA9_9PEZI|nr:hypothetical protein CPLU01_08151 [Colletotrichum plurivorum]